MICLCCGKEIIGENDYWHKKCIEKFFNSKTMPTLNIDLSERDIIKNIKVFTPGVQEKLSVHIGNNSDRISYYDDNSKYIIKLENNYKEIVAAEHTTMLMADAFKIKTCEHGMIKNNDKYVYIVKRFDRINNEKIHVEDFCQLSNRLTEDKYKGSYEKIGKLIDKYSSYKQFDKIEFFRIVLFSYITLNNDMHLKNFSLVEEEYNRLSLAYDLLPCKMFVDDGSDLALTLNGKDRNINKNDFLTFGMNLGINNKAVNKILNELNDTKEEFKSIINNSLLSENFKNEYIKRIDERIDTFK